MLAGEVAIELQRVGNHCKDIAAELTRVKEDVQDRTPPSAPLHLKQRNAALSDQLQQIAARFVTTLQAECSYRTEMIMIIACSAALSYNALQDACSACHVL